MMTEITKEILAIKAVILNTFGSKDKEKSVSLTQSDLAKRREKASVILDSMR